MANRCLLSDARLGQRHDRDAEPFLEHRPSVGAEAEAADIDDMRGRGEQRHQPALLERRRHDGEVVEVPGAEPGIVGEIDVARLHRLHRVLLEEVPDRQGHRIDVARRAGDRLRDHAAGRIEHAGREVARLAHRRREGGADQRLRLLLDHRDQAVPHDLHVDGGGGIVTRHGRRSNTIWPKRSMRASNTGGHDGCGLRLGDDGGAGDAAARRRARRASGRPRPGIRPAVRRTAGAGRSRRGATRRHRRIARSCRSPTALMVIDQARISTSTPGTARPKMRDVALLEQRRAGTAHRRS